MLCILGLLGPGSIFLVLVNISVTAFHIDPWISLVVHLVLILTFVSVCFLNGAHVQVYIFLFSFFIIALSNFPVS